MQQFRLTILDPTLAREFEIPLGITLIGREASTNLPIANPQISRRHAQLISDGQICELVDLGSANGTFIDGERLVPQQPVTLVDGMRIRFGPVETSFEAVDLGTAPDESSEGSIEAAAEAGPLETSEPGKPALEEAPVEEGSVLPEQDLVLDLPDEPPPQSEDAEAQLEQEEIEPPPEDTAGQDEQPPEEAEVPLEAILTRGPGNEDGSQQGSDGSQPPPPRNRLTEDDGAAPGDPFGLPGLSLYSRSLVNYLPGIYQTDFMQRFLGLFESIYTPIEWTVDAFDLYLDPESSPSAFLSWLGSWYGLTFDASWNDDQRRLLLLEAHAIFARRGTRWALTRILEIYTGSAPEITDTGDGIDPFTFRVRLPLPETPANRTLITRLIDAHKPAYTSYRLELNK